MTLTIILSCVALVAAGFAFGYFYPKKRQTVGTLRIDTSDLFDGPYMFLEVKTDIGDLMKRKTVKLDVNTECYIPQK